MDLLDKLRNEFGRPVCTGIGALTFLVTPIAYEGGCETMNTIAMMDMAEAQRRQAEAAERQAEARHRQAQQEREVNRRSKIISTEEIEELKLIDEMLIDLRRGNERYFNEDGGLKPVIKLGIFTNEDARREYNEFQKKYIGLLLLRKELLDY